MEKGEPRPFDEKAKKEIKEAGWVEEKDEVAEIIEHIKKNEGLLEEVKGKMKESGEKDLEKALREYAEGKIAQHKKTGEGIEERYK